jgi:hypothetical protein
MGKRTVAIVRFEKPLESVQRAIDLSHGLDRLPSKAKVFIKPNIVFWTRSTLTRLKNSIMAQGAMRNVPG